MTWQLRRDKWEVLLCIVTSSGVKLVTLRLELTGREDKMRSSAVSHKLRLEKL